MYSNPFDVTLLPAISTDESAAQIIARLGDLRGEYSLCDTNESVRFTAEAPCTRQELLPRLTELLNKRDGRAMMVVGDELAEPVNCGRYRPTGLTTEIRSTFLTPSSVRAGHLCGLVAIVPGPSSRTQDIDSIVDRTQLPTVRFEESIRRTANGLWLKSCHARATLVGDDALNRSAIQIKIAQSQQELQDCLALRHRVYNWMGYLDDDLSRVESKLEIDRFDKISIHFVAIDHRSHDVVGTVRLVLSSIPRHNPTTTVLRNVLGDQKVWCKKIALEATDAVLRERLNAGLTLPLPILQNSDFGDHWPEFLQANEAGHGGEISRLVVSPRYRGLGISSLLLRSAIATAYGLKKQYLLLECIPAHVEMYEKAGFNRLDDHRYHCRAQGLDQIAVGMRLSLVNQGPYNPVVSLAELDLHTIHSSLTPNMATPGPDQQDSQHDTLCLCDIRRCWKNGQYGSRGRDICPLTRLLE